MSIENTTGRLVLIKKPCEDFMVGREGSVPGEEAHCAGADSTVQSRSRKKPRTPPVGREIKEGTRGRHRRALQRLCHSREVTHCRAVLNVFSTQY